MVILIKNIEVYTPEYIGRKDILICENKIEGIYDELNIDEDKLKIKKINAEGKSVFPGFIDAHVHIIGGGGEDGYQTRTPELMLSDITKSGITTIVGCLGTDNVSRDVKTLIAKAKALKSEGISAYCYTGSYQIPVKTVTGSIKSDIILIDEIIGTGEIALSDHRSSQPTYEEFIRTVSESRIGGLLSGKSGVVNIHIGDGEKMLDFLLRAIEDTEIPPNQLLPTHINRNKELFEAGIEYVNKGGYIDLTTSCDIDNLKEGELRAGEALKVLLDRNVDLDKVTFTSDGNGSMPNFDDKGNLLGFGICSVESLYEEVKCAIKEFDVPIESALKVITSNAADRIKLKNKGRIVEGNDADLVIVDSNTLEIQSVLALGNFMIQDKNIIKKGTFEK